MADRRSNLFTLMLVGVAGFVLLAGAYGLCYLNLTEVDCRGGGDDLLVIRFTDSHWRYHAFQPAAAVESQLRSSDFSFLHSDDMVQVSLPAELIAPDLEGLMTEVDLGDPPPTE
jgi:hypothetical protein